MTQLEIEAALDAGRVQALTVAGRWWRVRRNGRTKTWKTRPGEFRIPVIAGFRIPAYISHYNLNSGHWRIV